MPVVLNAEGEPEYQPARRQPKHAVPQQSLEDRLDTLLWVLLVAHRREIRRHLRRRDGLEDDDD